MPNQTFKTRLKNMKFPKKLIYIASALTIISVFLPWYNDVDKFKIGDRFLGITGPLYLAGFIVLVASILSFGIITLALKDKSLPKLPLKEEHFFVFNSGLSLLMLVLCASVYFHNKFGVNIIDKSAGIGLTMAFFTCIASLIGGLLINRGSDVSFDTEGSLEPLIDLNVERKTKDLSIDKEITVCQAMEENSKKEEPVLQASSSEVSHQETTPNQDSVVQKAENQKLWGWGHNVDNNNKR